MRTCYTVIINGYDDVKQPFFISQHWKYVLFTDQDLELPENNIWEIKKIKLDGLSPAKTARRIKILAHEYIDTEESLFIDGTFFINVDLNRWWRRFQPPMTVIRHPFDDCIYTDIKSCMKGGKGDFWTLIKQAQDYKAVVPENNGLISSGILMRKDTPEVRKLCKAWWAEVDKYTERDQIAFGRAALDNKIFHTIEWNYTTQNEFIHCPHLHKAWRSARYKQIINEYGPKSA